MSILREIIEILTSGLTQFASGLGTGLNQFVTNIFLTGEGDSQALSAFGVIVVVFSGIALAVGLSRFVVNMLTSFGRTA